MKFDKIVVLLVVLNFAVVLAFNGGNGTVTNPYQIANSNDLLAINNDLDACYILVNDIDLSGNNYNNALIAADADINEDGYQGYGFTGILKGEGFKIIMPVITAPDENYLGLFGCIDSGGNVWNLHLESGGLVGSQFVGAFAGLNFGFINECSASCTIVGDYYVGGLVGLNFGLILKSFSTGDVTGSFFVGGVTGLNDGYSIYRGSILDCYSTSDVSGDSDSGGFVGNNFGYIERCYSIGNVSNTDPNYIGYIGGFVGWQSPYYGYVDSCFWDTETSGQSISGAGDGKSTAEMKDILTFKNMSWDYVVTGSDGNDDIWYQQQFSYPKLYWQYRDAMLSNADLDYNGYLEQNDFNVFASQWLTTKQTPRFLEADFNNDGFIDLADLSILAAKYSEK
jgi:hypothetical protein